jgi:hypothetical protein
VTTATPDVVVHEQLRARIVRLRRLGEDVIAELALTVFRAYRDGVSVEDIAGLVLWPVEEVRTAIERCRLDPDVEALLGQGPELDWALYLRDAAPIVSTAASTSGVPGGS